MTRTRKKKLAYREKQKELDRQKQNVLEEGKERELYLYHLWSAYESSLRPLCSVKPGDCRIMCFRRDMPGGFPFDDYCESWFDFFEKICGKGLIQMYLVVYVDDDPDQRCTLCFLFDNADLARKTLSSAIDLLRDDYHCTGDSSARLSSAELLTASFTDQLDLSLFTYTCDATNGAFLRPFYSQLTHGTTNLSACLTSLTSSLSTESLPNPTQSLCYLNKCLDKWRLQAANLQVDNMDVVESNLFANSITTAASNAKPSSPSVSSRTRSAVRRAPAAASQAS